MVYLLTWWYSVSGKLLIFVCLKFFFLQLLQDSLVDIKSQTELFSFYTLKILLHYCLAPIVKVRRICCWFAVLLWVMGLFFQMLLNTFSLYFCIIDPLYCALIWVYLFISLVLRVQSHNLVPKNYLFVCFCSARPFILFF